MGHERGGRSASLYPYMRGHYLGSGPGEMVLTEAGLDGESQAAAILSHLDAHAGISRPRTKEES